MGMERNAKAQRTLRLRGEKAAKDAEKGNINR